MQGPHEGHDHHPPRLRRALTLAALAAAPLPSPLAPLSGSPPLAGGAFASHESVLHQVQATTSVRVLVDGDGTPFSVTATQRLDVRRTGDYFFTIGAPLLDVARAAGSESDPGLRATTIVWAGFDPGRRVLAAKATLEPRAAAEGLPARIEVEHGRRWLVNATGVDVAAFTSEARKAPLLDYLARLRAALRAGRAPGAGNAELLSPTKATQLRIVVPLRVEGTVAGVLRDRLALPATGPLDLRVEPLTPEVAYAPADSGRTLLATAIRATLTAARARQYETYLGNPDPTGASTTSYRYVTARRPAAAPVVAAPAGHGALTAVLWALGGLGAAAAALAVWVRS